MATEMSGLYSDVVLDHFKNPRNVGVIEHPDAHVRVGDPTCGDSMEVFVKVDESVRVVTDISYLVYGCPGAIATSSVASEMIKGKDFAYCLALTDDDIVEALGGLPEGKRHCSLMVLVALRAALSELMKRAKCKAAL
jgi:nitrogen fixation NifU-like protein